MKRYVAVIEDRVRYRVEFTAQDFTEAERVAHAMRDAGQTEQWQLTDGDREIHSIFSPDEAPCN